MFNDQRKEAVAGSRALGWTSIGIGLMELLAPDQVQGMLGLEKRHSHRGVLRVLGVRELMHGVGILTEKRLSSQLSAGVWSRVAGDVLDTALLGMAAAKTRRPASFAAVAASVAAIGCLDLYYALKVKDARQSYRHRMSLGRLREQWADKLSGMKLDKMKLGGMKLGEMKWPSQLASQAKKLSWSKLMK